MEAAHEELRSDGGHRADDPRQSRLGRRAGVPPGSRRLHADEHRARHAEGRRSGLLELRAGAARPARLGRRDAGVRPGRPQPGRGCQRRRRRPLRGVLRDGRRERPLPQPRPVDGPAAAHPTAEAGDARQLGLPATRRFPHLWEPPLFLFQIQFKAANFKV